MTIATSEAADQTGKDSRETTGTGEAAEQICRARGPAFPAVTRRLRASAPMAVLVLLAAGRTVAQTADVTTWSRRRVVELARHIGWHYDTDADTVFPVRAVAS